MKKYDFGFGACMDSVKFSVETLRENPIKELGRAVLRAEQDPFFNKTMIDAWKKYIADHDIRWDQL